MKRNNINKNDILENIKHHHGLPISFSEQIFDFIFDIILEGLERDGKLKIAGFGTFKILKKRMLEWEEIQKQKLNIKSSLEKLWFFSF